MIQVETNAQMDILQKCLVLDADDNQMNRFPLCEILKSLSINTDEAENGLISLEKYKKYKEQDIGKLLILMDLDMPVMDDIT